MPKTETTDEPQLTEAEINEALRLHWVDGLLMADACRRVLAKRQDQVHEQN